MKLDISKSGRNPRVSHVASLPMSWPTESQPAWPAPNSPVPQRRRSAFNREQGGFTMLELLAILAVLAVGAAILAPTLATTTTNSMSLACKNNLRRLTTAWRLWTDENSAYLLYCGYSSAHPAPDYRPYWVTGYLDFSTAPSNYDVNQDLAKSPVWPLVGRAASAFKCPSDRSAVRRPGGTNLPRVRSYSMSQVFGTGEWLNKVNDPYQGVWRTYARASEIVLPSRTFLFMDVHPGSINDSAFKTACTGNLPTDPPMAAQIIDYPSPLHNGGCNLSFADGRAEAHRWEGSKIRNSPVVYDGLMPLNVPAESSWVDTHWLKENTTVRR